MLTIIDNVSNETIKYKQFSIPECEDNLEYSSLNLEIIKFPKKFFGANLKLEFEETETKTTYTFECRLDDDKLQKVLVRAKDFEDVTLSCFYLYEQYPNITSAIELSDKQKKDVEKRLLDTTQYEVFDIYYLQAHSYEPHLEAKA